MLWICFTGGIERGLYYDSEEGNAYFNEVVNTILKIRKFFIDKGYKLGEELIPMQRNNNTFISNLYLYENNAIIYDFIDGQFVIFKTYNYDGNNDTDNETEQNRVVRKSD